MHKKFDSTAIEKKWQNSWAETGLYDVGERDSSKEKEYILAELPYPSGNLHIGHWYAFAVPDIYVRYKRMLGKQVIYPMGFDAFGLPAENAAIKRNLNPKEWTDSNIAYMKDQFTSMGNAFSWDKTTATTNQDYYKWTQWMFTQFFENDIAYRGKGAVNWCPGCNTVIANEQVKSDNTCERCGSNIEKKEMPQWMLRITKYADRLIDDLEALDWPIHIKEAQKQWIGRSSGSLLDFKLSTGDNVSIFTTRADTLYGATYLVLAPEHPLVTKNEATIDNSAEVASYVALTKQKEDKDRLDTTREKTGVRLEGITALNPGNGEEIPVYISDYVLASYGTGAIMAVPAHDERDNAFAKKFNLNIKQVIAPHFDFGIKNGVETLDRGDVVDLIIEHPTNGMILLQREKTDTEEQVHFVGGGTEGESHELAIGRELKEETGFTEYEIVSGPYGVHTALAYRITKDVNQQTKSHFYHLKLKTLDQVASEVDEGKHTIEWVEKSEVSKLVSWAGHLFGWNMLSQTETFSGEGSLINSAEFDGLRSEEAKVKITEMIGGKMTNTYRLRDWSIGRQRYWGVPIPIVYDKEGKAHVIPKEHLPWLLPEDVDFHPTGVAPLAKSEELKKRTEEIFGQGWTPEVETMDTFVDSSWYFLRYIDNHNDSEFSSLKAQRDWMPVDLYFGGAEHTTMHLLYSRFWQKVLFDLKLVTESEPYRRRINRGLILGPDGNKMSKSKGNVVDPDEHVRRVGADTVKMYLAFMGPYEGANYPFDLGGIAGIRRFLERVNGLTDHITEEGNKDSTRLLHQTIKKVGEDILTYKFNTAISALMILVNQVEKSAFTKDEYLLFLRVLAPFAPHLTEELYSEAGENTSIHLQDYPVYSSDLAHEEEREIAVQINGKLRGTIKITTTTTEAEIGALIQASVDLQGKLAGQKITKQIYIPGRIVNLLTEAL